MCGRWSKDASIASLLQRDWNGTDFPHHGIEQMINCRTTISGTRPLGDHESFNETASGPR
jgi:hypothetical protein